LAYERYITNLESAAGKKVTGFALLRFRVVQASFR
jgi:hypothetical protein